MDNVACAIGISIWRCIYVQTFLVYALHIISFSIIYTWLYLNTNHSLFYTILFHGATDGIGAFFPVIASSSGQGPNLPTVIMEIGIALLMIQAIRKQGSC